MMPLAQSSGLVLVWAGMSVLLGTALLLLALVAQHIARRAVPSRLVWATGLALTLAITLSLPWRPSAQSDIIAPSGEPQAALSALLPAGMGWGARLMNAGNSGVQAIGQTLHTAASWSASQAAQAPVAVQWTLVLVWPLASLTVLVVFALSYRRHRQLLLRCPVTAVHGVQVHVSAVNGPVVFGALTPRIAVPEWLLTRTPEEQALVVRHEQTHIDAYDPMLLLAACGVAIILPWNPAVWHMLSRLRLAIELDCDARVLASGVSARRYGQLLIELAALPSMLRNPAAIPMSATAFSYRASHLERRLHTMTARSTGFLALRRVSVVTLAAMATLAACRAELPTSAELDAMDVAQAEARIGRVVAMDEASAEYYIDGKRVDRAEATSLSADRIATIDVRKQGARQQLFIVRTDSAAQRAAGQIVVRGERTPYTVTEQSAARPDTAQARSVMVGSKKPFDGLVIVNGQRSTEAALGKLSPSQIQSVEVVKGQAAVAQYGPDGANGVIRVTTKP